MADRVHLLGPGQTTYGLLGLGTLKMAEHDGWRGMRSGTVVPWPGQRGMVLMAALILAALAWVAPWSLVPAAGSCAEIQRRSPYAFTGVVVSTRSHGRVATVRTDVGATVQVRGTPDSGSGATSVDRSYEVGARYEFHPLNDSSPYEDNACTFTHLLSRDAEPTALTSEPAATDNRGAMVLGVIGFGVLGVAGLLAILWRRHSSDVSVGRVGRH